MANHKEILTIERELRMETSISDKIGLTTKMLRTPSSPLKKYCTNQLLT